MKRKFLRLILLVLAGFLVYAIFIEPAMLGFTAHEIPIRRLPREFDGFKIVQISDIHMNRWMRPKRVDKIVERVNAVHPDVVVLTGDFVSRDKSQCGLVGQPLAGLKAKYGVYAVLGNHDYWTDADAVTKALRASGIDVLFDEQRTITISKKSIRLVGLDDAWEGDPDYDKAYLDIPHEGVCITIAHNPDAVLFMKGKPTDLLMTGHTHGGIINLPIVGPLLSVSRLGPKYSSGMFTINDIRTYVCRGIGTGVGTHIRFRCPPEIPVFTLRRVP